MGNCCTFKPKENGKLNLDDNQSKLKQLSGKDMP